MKDLQGFRFRPPWWAWLAYLPMLALLLNLGTWQLRRAEAKEVMLATQVKVATAQPQDLQARLLDGQPAQALYGQPVEISGRYLGSRSFLQDSQVHEGQVGYHLWTPLATDAGLVLINRGWLAGTADRSHLPEFTTPLEPQQLRGLWRALPQPGLYLGETDCDRSLWPRVVQYPRIRELECLLQTPVVDGIVQLAPDQSSGYVREWTAGLMPPAKHYGYAVQWFALALALTVIFIWVNVRRDSARPESE